MQNKQTKVKNERISQQYYYPSLNDWEILSAISYCNSILDKKTLVHEAAFVDMCFFFFNGNEKATINSLIEVKRLYEEEYSKRHSN